MAPVENLINSPAFASRVEELLDQHHVPGLAIAVVCDQAIASAGFGLASLDPPKKFTPDTLLDIASASKSLTGAAIGLLVEDDERHPDIKYEAKMSNLLPEDFVMPGEGYTEGVTLEDILSHNTGMPGHDLSYLGPKAAQPDDARSVTRNLRNLAVSAPIRSKYMYCNMMYTVATHLVETATNFDFADFLEEHFFKPLDMGSTNLQPARARARNLGDRITDAHSWDNDSQTYKVFQSPDAPEAQGAGSIVTCVNDYIKYVKALMNQEGPFTKSLYQGLIKPRSLPDLDYEDLDPYTSPALYAAGWYVFYYRGYMVVIHDGSVPGIGTRHFFLPALKFGCVIFSNSEGSAIANTVLGRELIDEVLEVPQEERPDWNTIKSEKLKADDPKEQAEKMQQGLCPGIKTPGPQTIPLSAYTGKYWNAGYRGLLVEVKNRKLFIDATDRSFGSTFTFDHICDQTKYIVTHRDYLLDDSFPLKAEFVIEDGIAIKMGLDLEMELKEYIWFDRVGEEATDGEEHGGEILVRR